MMFLGSIRCGLGCHSFIVYGPLINRNSHYFEGKPIKTQMQVLLRIIDEHKVNAMFTAPTAIHKKEDPNGFHKKIRFEFLKP
jgi:propionyl-CoA synthetase